MTHNLYEFRVSDGADWEVSGASPYDAYSNLLAELDGTGLEIVGAARLLAEDVEPQNRAA